MSLTQIKKAGLDEIALDHVFTIGASGSSAYTFQGEGLNGTVNNPTLYLTRGKTYRFENGSGGHPIRIQSTSGASGTAYNTGVTNNAGSGTVIVEVQHDAPDVLYYQCTSHAAMNGILYITGALADGGVTTAKIAADAVTGAKIADDAINSEHYTDGSIDTAHIADAQITTTKIADSQIITAKINDSAVTTAKIADDAVTDAKLANSINSAIAANTAKTTNATHTGDVTGSTSLTIASGAVTTAKIADQAVTLAKLEHGTSSNNGKFLRANNGADPTFETVSKDLVADTSPQLGGNLDTNSQDILFSDNASAKFGAGTDLEIYHDPSSNDSLIKEAGSGALKICSNLFRANNAANSEAMIKAEENGAVELYYDNSRRIFTSPGGLQIDAAGSNPIITNTNSPVYANAGLELHRGGNGYCNVRFASNYGVTMSLAGIGNSNTTEFSLIQDNTGNAYVRNESTSPMRFQIGSSGLNSSNTMVMNNGGEVQVPRQPSFHAYNSGDSFSWNNGTVPFNAELFDVGGNYNTSNYRFTAPISGKYIFIAVFRAGGGFGEFSWLLQKNGSTINRIVAQGSFAGNDMQHGTVIVNVAANDYFSIYGTGSHGGATGGSGRSAFYGYLLG